MANILLTSDITGLEIGVFSSKAKALAALAAFDTPARKAAHTKRQNGTLHAIAARAAQTRKAGRAA